MMFVFTDLVGMKAAQAVCAYINAEHLMAQNTLWRPPTGTIGAFAQQCCTSKRTCWRLPDLPFTAGRPPLLRWCPFWLLLAPGAPTIRSTSSRYRSFTGCVQPATGS